jgi:hypothetical protein
MSAAASGSPGTLGTPSGSAARTRLQSTFEAIKKMGAGLSSPRIGIDFRASPMKRGEEGGEESGVF